MNNNKKIDKLITRTIIEHEGKILIVRRSKTDKTRAGVWELPGGGVDNDESLEEAAEREVLEEAGIKVQNITFFSSMQYIHPDGSRRLGAIFHAVTSSFGVKLSFEHDKFEWIDISNIHNTRMDEENKKRLIAFYGTDVDHVSDTDNDDLSTTKDKSFIVHTDGGSRGNPGPSAAGYVIEDLKGQILVEGGEYLGITTNNQAEYQAVRIALVECSRLGGRRLQFYIDSMLVVNQMNGIFKVKNRDLWPIHENVKLLMKEFNEVTFTHVRREKNVAADTKVNEVLDNYKR